MQKNKQKLYIIKGATVLFRESERLSEKNAIEKSF